MLQRGTGGSRQQEEKAGGHHQYAERHGRRERPQPHGYAAGAFPHHHARARGRPPDFPRRERGNGENQEKRQESEETQTGRDHAGGQQFEKRDHPHKRIVTAAVRAQRFDRSQEEHQPHGGGDEIPREELIVYAVKDDAGQSQPVRRGATEFEVEDTGNQQRAHHQRRSSDGNGDRIDMPRTSERKEAARNQAQQRKLEELLHP